MPETTTSTPKPRRRGSIHVRLALLALALVAALISVSYIQRSETDDGPRPGRSTTGDPNDTDGAGEFDPDFTPGAAGETVDPTSGGAVPTDPEETSTAEDMVFDVEIDGTPVDDGATVGLELQHVKGTVSRYRVVVDQLVTDRETETSRGRRLLIWLRTEVIEVRQDGSATISLTLEDFYTHVVLGELARFTFDSRDPDESLLEEPSIAGSLAPLRATLGLPLEVDVDAAGRATAVHGVDRWQEATVEALRAVTPDVDAPPVTERSVLVEYGEWLFPGLAGEPLTVPERREYASRQESGLGRDVTVTGTWTVTHDDPHHYVVRATGRHGWEDRPGPAPTRNAARVAGYRVYPVGEESFVGRWRIERSPARVSQATITQKYQQWVSFGNGPDAQRHFQILELRTQVELVD